MGINDAKTVPNGCRARQGSVNLIHLSEIHFEFRVSCHAYECVAFSRTIFSETASTLARVRMYRERLRSTQKMAHLKAMRFE
jgi:hypothetical protein